MPRTTDFNVLEYWKTHCVRFPILAQMIRDILAIPISTVASESTFSIGGRVLDPYRSSLKPSTVEALVCLRDWAFDQGNWTLFHLKNNILELFLSFTFLSN